MIVTVAMFDAARDTLGLTDELDLSADKVKTAYRERAKAAHPDGGGSLEAFAAVDRAKHVMLAWLERSEGAGLPPKPHGGGRCPRCHGGGYVTLRKGFRELRLMCPTCRGSGEAGVEHDDKEAQ